MEARFVNGSFVSRVWGDDSTELLAAFQYDSDAISFAEGKVAEDAKRAFANSFYVVSNTYSGKITVLLAKTKKAEG